MKKLLQVIHIEDSPDDSELVEHLLHKNGLDCAIRRIDTRAQLFKELEHSHCDVILADCSLPNFNGFQALEIARALKPEVPFIFVSGTIGEETAIKSLQDGATDYVLKQRMSRLVPAVRRALAESSEKAMLRAMRTRLHQARRLQAIGTLAGGIAHDFNNLLQIIKLQVALLSLEKDSPDQIDKITETIDKAADRGTEIMQELLVFARKTDAHLISVDLAKLIGGTVEKQRTVLPQGMSLILELDNELPQVFVDPAQIDRILTNLIKNARDAMPSGGAITISADVVELDSPSLSSGQGDNEPYLRLKVSDTGMGMDESTRLQAFEPFFTTKALERGTGLGLSVVFGLMQIHNGLIEINSKPGEGTTVSLFFPLPQGTEIAPEKIKKIPHSPFPSEYAPSRFI